MLRMEFIGGDVLAAVLRSYGDKVQTAIVQSVGRSALKLQKRSHGKPPVWAGAECTDGQSAPVDTPARNQHRQRGNRRGKHERPLRQGA